MNKCKNFFVFCLVFCFCLFFRINKIIVCVNSVYADSNSSADSTNSTNNMYSDNFNYNETGRTNKNIPTRGIDEKYLEVLKILKYFPGIGTFMQAYSYLGLASHFTIQDAKEMLTGDFVNGIALTISGVLDSFNMTVKESDSAWTVDKIFYSNLYCKYQKIYEEEEELISKSNAVTKGGLEYPMFPIYPLDIGVNEKGFCDLNVGNFNEYFKSTSTTPIDTKCSYSYSATSQQCISDFSDPMIKTYDAQDAIATAICAKGAKASKKTAAGAVEDAKKEVKGTTERLEGIKERIKNATGDEKIFLEEYLKKTEEELVRAADKLKEAQKQLTKATVKLKKYGTQVDRAILSIFTDTRYIYDPVVLFGMLSVEFVAAFTANTISDLLGNLPPNPKDLTEMAVCMLASVSAFEVFKAVFETEITYVSKNRYEKAVEAIKNFTFCGYDWLGYTKTLDGKYYTKGASKYSYYRAVSDCINNKTDGECDRIPDDYACQEEYKDSKTTEEKKSFCVKKEKDQLEKWEKITKYSPNIKNRVFREYVYGGKEYEAGMIELNINEHSNDNRLERFIRKSTEGKNVYDKSPLFKIGAYSPYYCIDPRTPEQKGFQTLNQRYYMRGNEKANFACSRFFYDGKSPCILLGDQLDEEDRNTFKEVPNTSGKGDVHFYILPSGDEEKINKYAKSCKEMFEAARRCCKFRSRHLICLIKKDNQKYNFCFSNVVEEYSNENMPGTSLLNFLNSVQNNGDFFKTTCELDGVKFEATKRAGSNHVCVFSYGFCPYDFKLNAGLNYKATYCDANYLEEDLDSNNTIKRGNFHLNVDDCKKGIFNSDTAQEYINKSINSTVFSSYSFDAVLRDMDGYNSNDFNTIYDTGAALFLAEKSPANLSVKEKETLKDLYGCDLENSSSNCKEDVLNYLEHGYTKKKVAGTTDVTEVKKYDLNTTFIGMYKTSAYGKIKNFCQYRAHCVEVEEEKNLDRDFTYSNLFMDSSCTGTTNNSRNIFQGQTGGLPKQLSAPIVECIHESLKNMINGIVGNSSCIEDYGLNNEGFCGSDTEEVITKAVKTNDKKILEKYNTIGRGNDIKYIIKGQPLPLDYNPFLRMQVYFINIIRAALTLFLVVYFYRLFFSGKIGDFTKPENMAKLVFNVFKFSLVIWLIFYNGWQSGIYKKVVNFSSAAYSFVSVNFSKAIGNSNAEMLHYKGEKTIKLSKEDLIAGTRTPYTVCYRYNYINNIEFAEYDEVKKNCPKGYKRKNNNSIIIKSKKEKKQEQNESNLIISTNQEMSALVYFVDKYNEIHSDELIIDGISTMNKNANLNYLTNGSYEKEYIWNKYYDGCYFDSTEYKEDKSYLAIFDTLDCKLIRYLGYSTDKLAPNLIIYSMMLIVPNYIFRGSGFVSKIIGGLGSMLFGALMSFMFIMFNLVIKIVYLFLSSFFTLSIMIFVSPIVLPLMFYERTKKMVDTWLELIVDNIMKPIFSISLMMIYIELMDKILLKNAMFVKHDSRGRGPILYCYKGSVSSFVCIVNSLLNEMDGSGIAAIFNQLFHNLFPFLADILVVILLFTLSDTILETLEQMVSSLFKFISDPNKSGSPLYGTGKDSVARSEGGEGMISSFQQGMQAGAQLEAFRANYLTKAPGAALDNFINKTTGGGGNAVYSKKPLFADKNSIEAGIKPWRIFKRAAYGTARFSSATTMGAGRITGRIRDWFEKKDDKARNLIRRGVQTMKGGVKDLAIKYSNYKTTREYISSTKLENNNLNRLINEEKLAEEDLLLAKREGRTKLKIKILENKLKRKREAVKDARTKIAANKQMYEKSLMQTLSGSVDRESLLSEAEAKIYKNKNEINNADDDKREADRNEGNKNTPKGSAKTGNKRKKQSENSEEVEEEILDGETLEEEQDNK